MIRIERHTINVANWPEFLEGRRARLDLVHSRRFPEHARNFGGYGDLGRIMLALLSVLDREAEDQFVAARALSQGYAGLLALGDADREKTVELPFGDRRGQVRGTGPTSSTHVNAWIDGWYGALMARDTESLDRLAAIDAKTLANSSTRTDPYRFAWKAALIAARQGEDVAGPVEAASHLAASRHRKIAGTQLADADVADFAILPTVVERNEAAFQEALAKALEAHRNLWSAADPERNDHMGYVAWGPLALSCLAADRGMAVAVESDFLMPRLITSRP